jgi:hypothetical protein
LDKAAIVVPTGFLIAATGIGFKIRLHIMEYKQCKKAALHYVALCRATSFMRYLR